MARNAVKTASRAFNFAVKKRALCYRRNLFNKIDCNVCVMI